MTGPITWEAVAFLVGLIVPVAGAIIWFSRRINQVKESLDAHKLYAAETFATKEGMTTALRDVKDSVDRLTERLDRWFDAEPPFQFRRRPPGDS